MADAELKAALDRNRAGCPRHVQDVPAPLRARFARSRPDSQHRPLSTVAGVYNCKQRCGRRPSFSRDARRCGPAGAAPRRCARVARTHRAPRCAVCVTATRGPTAHPFARGPRRTGRVACACAARPSCRAASCRCARTAFLRSSTSRRRTCGARSRFLHARSRAFAIRCARSAALIRRHDRHARGPGKDLAPTSIDNDRRNAKRGAPEDRWTSARRASTTIASREDGRGAARQARDNAGAARRS